jgi:hypothetical protein
LSKYDIQSWLYDELIAETSLFVALC